MEGTVGIRGFRDRLTRYVARVRRGQPVVVTDRGKPVAVLVPYEGTGETTLAGGEPRVLEVRGALGEASPDGVPASLRHASRKPPCVP